MYRPKAFAEDDLDVLHDFIEQAGLATLVTSGEAGLTASHIPFILDRSSGERGVLRGHLARPNPQWKAADGAEALVIFHGADAYVSPRWYASKEVHGKVVPTWNYIAVHATGPLRSFDDSDALLKLVNDLTDRYEAGRPEPWSVADAPADYISAQLKGIVGVEIEISRLEGKWKLSQNKNAADRAGVALGLTAEGSALAGLIPADDD